MEDVLKGIWDTSVVPQINFHNCSPLSFKRILVIHKQIKISQLRSLGDNFQKIEDILRLVRPALN